MGNDRFRKFSPEDSSIIPRSHNDSYGHSDKVLKDSKKESKSRLSKNPQNIFLNALFWAPAGNASTPAAAASPLKR
jgi:hypothetical protein